MKISRLALLALALPMGLAAQTPAGPPVNPITTVFRNRITALHRNLGMAFDSIPEAKFGYKPTPAQLTVGYIAQHLASDSYFFCGNFGAMKPSRPEKETTTPDSLKAAWPKADLVAQLRASFAFCDEALAQVDDAKLADQLTMPGPNGTTRQATRAASVIGHAMDMADHYSQIANYMRLNNMIPPSALPRPRPAGT
ncbi:MAG: DinB family protein [Gemmatimonadaceae bacterium]